VYGKQPATRDGICYTNRQWRLYEQTQESETPVAAELDAAEEEGEGAESQEKGMTHAH